MQKTYIQGSVTELLEQVAQFFSIADMATEFQVNQSTIHRWMNGSVEPKSFIADRLVNMLSRKMSAQDNDEKQGDFTLELSSQVQLSSIKKLIGSLIAQTLPWAEIYFLFYRFDIRIGHIIHRFPLRQILADQSVCVLVRPPFPRMVWRRKIELDAKLLRDFRMEGEFLSPVRGNGFQYGGGKPCFQDSVLRIRSL